MKLAVGVMGSSSPPFVDGAWEKLVQVGRRIAEHDCALITGACPGLPFAAVEGAKGAGGLVIGISPGLSLKEHLHRYGSPVDGFDVIIYTGSGLMAREIENIRSSDIVIIAGGRSGTLGEFAIAYDEGRLLGVLSGTGGIADAVPELVRLSDKRTGAAVLFDEQPNRLVDRLIEHYRKHHYKRPNVFAAPVAIP
jgi:uncharacterized protein (TIGR00725 family)